MKIPLHNKLELIGLFIVLFATTFQLTFMTKFMDAANDAALVRIEQKMNYIWYQVTDRSTTDQEEMERAEGYNFWMDEGKIFDVQRNWVSDFYALFMLIGSGMLLVGRYLEIKSRPKSIAKHK